MKQKKIMILGGGKNQIPLIKAAKKLEYHVVVCDERKDVQGKQFCDKFININGDKIIGYAWAYVYPFRQEERIYFNEMHVLDEYRSHGIGSRFLQCIENEGRERGLPAIYFHTEGHNEKAIKLYLRKGYEIERLQFRKAL